MARVSDLCCARQSMDEARAAKGKLLIVSLDRSEPSKEVLLIGFGPVNKVEQPGAAPQRVRKGAVIATHQQKKLKTTGGRSVI